MSGFLTQLIIGRAVPFDAQAARETVCGCDFSPCFEERVFADAAGSGDSWKADKSSFLYLKTVAGDSVTFEIWRGEKFKLADASNTYGDYYASVTGAPLYTAFIVDWTKIFNTLGGGVYTIKIQVTNFGNSYTLTSRRFHLYPYSPELAHNTTRVEAYQTGNIIAERVDYSALLDEFPTGWYSSIRLPALFGKKTPQIETDQYLDSNYRQTQNRDQIINEYTLETKYIPASIANDLTQRQILSNSILITAYDLYASEIFRELEVTPVNISEVNHAQERGGAAYSIVFTDRTQNVIKRNF